MATCKDCVHCDVCDMPIITDGRKNASNCKKFKNKADFVEVVRCKDCQHKVDYCGRHMCGRQMYKIGEAVGGLVATLPEHFCSYGERKET